MAPSTVHTIVKETCKAISDVLDPIVMPAPTKEDWNKIEREFYKRWNFPNCIGALDGKHCVITSPGNSGGVFWNYKGTFSINLMALVDASYKFIFVDIGQLGSNADGGVFRRSEFGQAFLNKELDMPDPKPFPNMPEAGVFPCCIVADKAFPLRPDLMRPYPRKTKGQNLPLDKAVFNYRLSRARRIVENAFGILAQRWRLLNRRIQMDEDNVDYVIHAMCCLHNYLTETKEYTDSNTLVVDDDGIAEIPAGNVINMAHLQGYHSAQQALQTRDLYKTYFNSPQGAVPWQWERLMHH